MATKQYISFNNLSKFLDNIKNIFATKTEVNAKSDKNHTHNISDISNLQTTLDNKASTSHGTHVTHSATTPLMDGTASAGIASTVARSDHRHPTDSSRAAQTSLDSHTGNTTTHITSAERTNWNSAYTHSQSSHSPSNAEPNQNAFSNVKIGDVTIAADIKTDTLTLVAGNNITLTPDATNDKITITAKDTTYTLGSFGITATAAELNKLDGVTATTTEINYVNGVTSNIQTQLDNKVPTSRTINGKALSSNITLSASDIGADASGTAQAKADGALSSAKNYTDTKISALINSAPTTLDTLGEIATAMEENADVVTALEDAVGTKANASDLTSHTSNKSNPHSVTKAQIGLGNVENKSSATIRSELTKANVTTALGYTPPTTNTTYGVATSSTLGLIKSGTDITVDTNGNVSINDDSHNHTITNIDNLQTSLDGKQATVTGGASTITSSNLTANRALISSGSGKVAVSAVTSTELGYLDGVSSNVQTQLDGKAASSHTHNYAGSSSAGGAATSANKLNTNDGSATQPVYFANGIPVATTYTLNKSVPSNAVFTDTHYSSKNVVGATNATSNTASVLSNGNVYLNSIENGAVTSSHKISGSGATTVTTDANGNIVITSTDNNTTYSAADSDLGLVKSGGDVTISSGVITVNDDSHNHTITNIDNLQTTLDGKSNTSHTHKYASSSSAGGSATSAVKLDTDVAGDVNTPVYFSGGKPVACTSLDLNTSGSSASCTGNSATATKLQTARTIGLGTGATGTATSFNGTGNITIPVTDVKEAYLSWGGKNLVGSVSPIGAALSSEHSANRIAYLNPSAIKVEYSNDAGSTWADSGLGNSAKTNFVTTSNGISVGSNSTVTTNHRTRVTLTAQDGTNGYVYTRPRKMLINVSTAGHGLTVTIEAKTGVSGANWTTLGTYELNGWYGWNDIPMSISTFGGGANQTGNYWYMRLTFATTSVSTSYTTTKSSIIGLRLFGDTCWTRTSNMGETGHLYSYDSSQNATFPANVTATTFVGALSGNATTATTSTKLGSTNIGNATQPIYLNGGTPTACTYTLGKSVPSNAVFTDTNTKVTNTLATTTKAYVTGTTSASTNTGTQIFDTGVYLDTTAGQLTATTFNGTTFSGSGVATLAEVQSYLGI